MQIVDFERRKLNVARITRAFLVGGLASATLLSSHAEANETRSYVVSWFYAAMYQTPDDCPQGLNPKVEGLYLRILRESGKSPSEIEKLADEPTRHYDEIATNRGRIDGKPANVYLSPTSAPDPHIKTGQGKLGFGFNLDGADGPSNFTDPETQEKGVDNQLSRAFACFESTRGSPEVRGIWPVMQWDSPRDAMQAWLVQISGIDNAENDDEIEVGFYRATRPVMRNAIGEPQRGMTFHVEASPRLLQNRVRGRIKDGLITTDTFDFFLTANPYIQPEFSFDKARVRFRINANGTLTGYIGGYASIDQAYMGIAAGEGGAEGFSALDVPGIYYAMQRLGDGATDPETGRRTTISATYRIDAVPAFFTVPPDAAKTK